MPIRAVSFDLFDTLVDLDVSGAPLQQATRALYAALSDHTELDFESFGSRLREIDREVRREHGSDHREVATEDRFGHVLAGLGIERPELARTLTGIHMGILRDCVAVPAHHADVLRRLRERVPVGLCSNFTHAPTARGVLDEAALTAHLDPVVISVDVGLRKPRREIFEAVLEGLGAAPEETLHVGDSLAADVVGAAALGMPTVWLTRRVQDPEAALAGHTGAWPDFVCADVEEILPLLDG